MTIEMIEPLTTEELGELKLTDSYYYGFQHRALVKLGDFAQLMALKVFQPYELDMGSFGKVRNEEGDPLITTDYGHAIVATEASPLEFLLLLEDLGEDRRHQCETSCCAIGATPLIEGMPTPEKGESWAEYSTRVYGIPSQSHLWDFLFSGDWHNVDDSWEGLRDRVRYVLQGHKPMEVDYEIHDFLNDEGVFGS